MRRTFASPFALIVAAACGVFGVSCGGSDGTYVVVTMEAGAGAPPTSGLQEIALALSFSGKTENVVVKDPAGKAIVLPADFALVIRSGQGLLTLDASARAGGQEVGGGRASVTVAAGAVTRVTAKLDFPRVPGATGDGGAGDTSPATSDMGGGTGPFDGPGGNDDARLAQDGAPLDAGGRDAAALLDGPADALTGDGAPDATLFPVLSVQKTEHDFGMVLVGNESGPATVNVSNTGTASTAPLMVGLGGTNPGDFAVVSDGCGGVVLKPNETCTITVRLAPKSAGTVTAALTVTSSPAGTASVSLRGTAVAPGAISVSPASHPFGSLVVGTTADGSFTVTNTGGANTGPITIALDGTDKDQFALVPGMDTCSGMALSPQGTCSVGVRFGPTTSGAKAASLTASGMPGGTGTAALLGTALAPAALTLTPVSHGFGNVSLGSAGMATFTVKNDGDQPSGVPMFAFAGPDAGEFSIPANGNGCTEALAAGASCAVDVRFAPGSAGPRMAMLTVTGSPGGASASTLTGMGQEPVALTVLKTGTGTGAVTSGEMPASVSCGMTCSATYYRTTSDPMVTLTAAPDESSTFAGWSGCTSASGPTCQVTLDAAKMVTATFTIKTFTLTVTRTETDGATGTVKSTGGAMPALDCGSTCMASYPYGTMVTLEATPTAQYFGGWAGDCTGFAGCTVSMTADRMVTARFNPANRTFVTANTYTVAFLKTKGTGTTEADKLVSGADWACDAAAKTGGLTGKFVAWVARDGINANSRLGMARGWLRGDGRPFADALVSPQFPGQTFYPAALDEYGTSGDEWDVLTGAMTDGSAAAGGNCANWTVTDATQSTRTGVRGGGASTWTSYYTYACDRPLRLHCFGVDHAARVTVPTPPASKKYIFVTSSNFRPGGGLAAADGACNNNAMAYGLPGTYKALLATTSASIASRFTVTNVPVIRPDGVWVASTDAELLTAGTTLLAPISVEANGTTHVRASVWSGASSPAATSPSDGHSCNGWTSTSSMLGGIIGASEFTGSGTRWLNEGTPLCTASHPRLYCLQE